MVRVIGTVTNSFDPADGKRLGDEFYRSQAFMVKDPLYAAVRDRIKYLGPVRSLVRLEIGWALGGRYSSLWFVDTGSSAFELATGYEWDGIRERRLDYAKWVRYRDYLASIEKGDVTSEVSTTIVDGQIYFFCAHAKSGTVAFILEAMPAKALPWNVLAHTFELSQFKSVPREFKSFGVPNGR